MIQMPNYCVNLLVIDDIDPAFREILKQDGLRFNSLVPMPDSASNEERWAAEDLLRRGTVSFETAWNPPEFYLKALAAAFPNQSFELYWLDSERYEFGGVIRYRAGLDEGVNTELFGEG